MPGNAMKIKILSLIAAGVLFFSVSPARTSGDEPLIKAIVRPQSSTVGAVLEYRINIAGRGLSAKDFQILLPEKKECYPEKEGAPAPAKNKNGEEDENPAEAVPLYVIHRATRDDRSTEGVFDLTAVLELSFFRPGKYSLPGIDIKNARGEKVAYQVPVVEIKETNAQGTLEEIEPPLDLGGNYTRLIILIAAVIAATLAAVFLFRYIKRKRAEKAAKPEPVPPLEIFLRDMAKLGGADLIAAGKIEEYVFGVSMIFRKFLSSLYNIDATEMTSDEIDRLLKKVMSRESYARNGAVIMQSFHLWDLSKFAEFAPSQEILEANLEKTGRMARNLSEEMSSDPARV